MKLAIESIHKRYGEQTVLKDFSLSIDDCSCLALIGPSGGGKSTLLRLLAGLERPDSGRITLNGNPLPHSEKELRNFRRSIGVVFQSYNLFPHLTALQNLQLPLEQVHGFSREASSKRAKELLERFQLSNHGSKRPAALSGGQNQRVAIARAIAHNPSLVLFDEPTAALDPEMSAEVLDVIEELIHGGTDCIIVTHQMGFARRASAQVAFLSQGKALESGDSQSVFTHPRHPELIRFLERELKY